MSQEFKFGKKILNTLITGMYKSAMFIYREYIQNAADAIDDAIEQGLECPEGFQIHVKVDVRKRCISIEDNATGIPQDAVRATLGNVGDSKKDPRKKKGFIGIGRLGGLGYCEKVVFETSYIGEEVKTISVWEATRIREIIHDSTIDDDAQSVLRNTVSFRTEPCDGQSHFFKVTLSGITKENDELLDMTKVYPYLQMVSPAEFSYTDFPHKKTIRDFIENNGLPKLNEYQIFLNQQKITKGYKSKLRVLGQKDCVVIKDVQLGLIKDEEDILGWYWYGITDFSGTMEKFWQSGMRLRKGNIQIGEEDCLYQHKMWRERRGNFYFFGEVHALDPELIPNGRRDYFEENSHCRRFERALKELFDRMLDIVYDASHLRSAASRVEKVKTEIKGLQEKIHAGNFDDEETRAEAIERVKGLNEQFTNDVSRLNKLKDKLVDKKDDAIVGTAVSSIVESVDVSTRPIKPLERPEISQSSSLATDNLTPPQKIILDLVKEVLASKLPPEELDSIWSDVLKKIKML